MNPLFAVRHELRTNGMATVSQLAAVLQLSPQTVRNMIDYWQQRGQVRPYIAGAEEGHSCKGSCKDSCGGSSCAEHTSPADMQVYQWCGVDKKTATVTEVFCSQP